MFKRFQAMDLFHEEDEGNWIEWVPVERELPSGNGIYRVKISNGDEVVAYFCEDKWWSKKEKQPLLDVKFWGKKCI